MKAKNAHRAADIFIDTNTLSFVLLAVNEYLEHLPADGKEPASLYVKLCRKHLKQAQRDLRKHMHAIARREGGAVA